MDKQQEYINLGWKILECKLLCYRAELVHKSWLELPKVTDAEYDSIENRYTRLYKELNLPPTASDTVGFDLDRPACRLVLSKYKKERK